MDGKNDRSAKKDQLAREVLRFSRNTLLVNLRFLDLALGSLDYVAVENGTLFTDGTHIFYQAGHILKTYKKSRETSARDYFHIILHCIFRHMYVSPAITSRLWDLACDIAVENMITELGVKGTAAPREKRQAAYLNEIKDKQKQVTAERIYAYLRGKNWKEEKLAAMEDAFRADDHSIWYLGEEEKQRKLGISAAAGSSLGQESTQADGEGKNSQTHGEGKSTEGESAYGHGFSPSLREEFWKKVSGRMQVELETFGKMRGMKPGALTQNLTAVNRERYDYTAFLKKFAVLGEAMRINDDEYDYIFYTYGLRRYKNMPLIEPLEYKEVKRIREFVIAIDTSGSTSGELVQRFMQKTYNILKSTESFFSKINLHIIQCDAQIQEDAKITSQEEFDRYLENMKIRGLGGTDFRPVFQYVEQLRREKEFQNLRGLIYFTDGYGRFPERKPDYETAFVFIREGYEFPEVPAWAIKLVLEQEEI